LTKGPVGIVIAGGTAFFYLYFKHGWRDAFGKMDIARGVLWLLAVAVPWYVYMTLVHGDAFIDTFLGYHNVTRFLEPEHQEGAHYYYYLPIIALGFFPWIGFIFPIFKYVKRAWSNDKFLVIWSLWVFVFFTLSQTRLPSYILPMFPPLAILMAKYFYASIRDDKFPKWCAFVPLIIALFMSFVFYKANRVEGLSYQAAITLFTVVVIALSSVHIFFVFRRMFNVSVYALYSLAVFFLVFSVVVIFPLVGQYNSTRVFASDLKRLVKPETVFIIHELHVPSVIFYTDLVGKKIENFGALLNNIRVCKKRGERVIILMRKSEYYKLKKVFKDSVKAVRFSGRKVLVVVE
ncbi:MAG: hypothetical protein J7L41_04435, partial [Synergistetes bacterium]|nr:hypothetical protein [Synergistota bacterium]